MSDYQNYQTESAVAAALAADSTLLESKAINKQTILVNPSAKILSLEQYEGGRSRKRGTFATQDLESFTGYVEHYADEDDPIVFINKDAMKAVAILNFEADGFEQGHLDHRAILTAEQTATFSKLLNVGHSGRIKQKVFAEFLEDWGHQLVARDEEGNEIENAKAINAIRNMRIDESAQTDSSAGNYRETRSRLESVEAKSIGGALPAHFTVYDECYYGLGAQCLKLRLGISSDEGVPVFKLDVIGLQLLIDNLAKDFAKLVEEGFTKGEIKVAIGKFEG